MQSVWPRSPRPSAWRLVHVWSNGSTSEPRPVSANGWLPGVSSAELVYYRTGPLAIGPTARRRAAERARRTAATPDEACGGEPPEAAAPDAEASQAAAVAAILGAGAPADLDTRIQAEIAYGWDCQGRDQQKPPKGDWRTWVLMGGRGSGKTRAGAEWVHGIVRDAGRAKVALRIALVAETLGDAREVMVDGPSGICRIARHLRPTFEVSRRRLVWPNGAVAHVFSSEDPESLRGPQFDFAWCDELAKWTHAQETWDMLQFGLRLGAEPRQLVTTTPRPLPLLRAILAAPDTATTRMRTADNAANLAPGFVAAIEARYGGSRLGRQELGGELIEDREDALWRRADIERLRVRRPAAVGRIVVAVDPPAAASAKDSCCGIVVAGLDTEGRGVVLADGSVEGASPAAWGRAVVKLYRRFRADRVVAEINQGGDMVMLLGIPGDNTYANYTEANRAFYRLTVLPLLTRTAAALGNWLAPLYGGGLRLAYDTDAIAGLAAEREALWKRIGDAPFLTDAEKREAVGYQPLAGK